MVRRGQPIRSALPQLNLVVAVTDGTVLVPRRVIEQIVELLLSRPGVVLISLTSPVGNENNGTCRCGVCSRSIVKQRQDARWLLRNHRLGDVQRRINVLGSDGEREGADGGHDIKSWGIVFYEYLGTGANFPTGRQL
jgi:hypothetical protein